MRDDRVIENKHSTDVESSFPAPRVYVSIPPEGRSYIELGQVPVLNDPSARKAHDVHGSGGAHHEPVRQGPVEADGFQEDQPVRRRGRG